MEALIKDLDLYPQLPTNTRSPTLNSEEPLNQEGGREGGNEAAPGNARRQPRALGTVQVRLCPWVRRHPGAHGLSQEAAV